MNCIRDTDLFCAENILVYLSPRPKAREYNMVNRIFKNRIIGLYQRRPSSGKIGNRAQKYVALPILVCKSFLRSVPNFS